MKNLFLFIISFGFALQLVGQPLPSEEVDVLKKFDATLGQMQKLRTLPTLPYIDTTLQPLRYNIPTRLLTLNYEPPRIRPLALKREAPVPTYNFFAKAGYGLPNMPLVDLSYNSGRIDNIAYSVFGRHLSANSNAVENQRFSETGLGVEGTYYADAFAVNGQLQYDYDVVHFYGYEADTLEVPADSVRQHFSLFQAHVDLFNSTITRGDLSYKVGLDFYTLGDNYESNETGVDIHLTATKWFANAHALKVIIGNDYSRFNGDLNRPTNNVFYIRPSFTYHGGTFQVKAGAFLAAADSGFYALPDVEASVNLAGDKFAVLAGWTGNVHKNTFRNLTDYNPFLNATMQLRNTRTNFYYGGLRGNFNKFKVEGKVGFKQFNDLALFLNDTANFSRFNVLYDDVNSVNIHAGLTFTAIENLDLTATLDFNTFETDSLAKAWHLPNFELNITAIYRLLNDKLRLKAELFNLGGISYLDENQAEQTTGALFDLSFGAAYQISDNFGVFLDLNNVTNQTFQRWYRYPNFGFNLLGGITVKF